VRGIDDVMADVILEQFRGQTADGAPDRCDEHEYVGAAQFRLQSPLYRVKLSLNAPDAGKEL